MTTMTLETLFRAAVDDGRLVNLTLFRTGQGWQAAISTGVSAWRIHIDADPVAALAGVLDGAEEPDIFG